jgi:hypothetical protein
MARVTESTTGNIAGQGLEQGSGCGVDYQTDLSQGPPLEQNSSLALESFTLLAALPPPEPLPKVTPAELQAAKRSIEQNINRHQQEFPQLKDIIIGAADAIIEGDVQALQKVLCKIKSDPAANQIVANELDRDLGLLGVRVMAGNHEQQTTLDILRIGDNSYLSVPVSNDQAPVIRGPVTYLAGDRLSLGSKARGTQSDVRQEAARISHTIIAWQAIEP